MSNNLSIDASVFISALLKQGAESKSSREFLQNVRGQGLFVIVPLLTLMEVLQSLYRITKNLKFSDEILEQFVEWNIAKGICFVPIDASFFSTFTAHHHHFDLKTSDTIVAINALAEKTVLVTWDKKLIKQCKNKVTALTPKQFLKFY